MGSSNNNSPETLRVLEHHLAGCLAAVRSLIAQAEGRSLAEPWVGDEISSQGSPESPGNFSGLHGDPAASQAHMPPRVLLGEAVDRYLDLKRAEGLSARHLKQTEQVLRHFEEFSGGAVHVRRPRGSGVAWRVEDIDRRLVADWRTHVLPGRSVTTVNLWLTILGGWLRWAAAEGLRGDENLVARLRMRQTKRAREARSAFTDEQVERVFGADFLDATKPGSANRWIPLLCLWGGLRPEEAAQLRVGDVSRIPWGRTPSLWTLALDLRPVGDGQRRKSKAAQRVVPLPPRVAHAMARELAPYGGRGMEEPLFPELTRGAADTSRLADSPSRWFNRRWLRRRLGISDPGLVLYSARHTYATALKRAGVAEPLISELMGHENSSVTTGRYGKAYDLDALCAAVATLPWKGSW